MQDQCNLSYKKDECRPDPDCIEQKSCEEKIIVPCVIQKCDENLGEMVCTDEVQQTNCKVIQKTGEATGQPCGKNLMSSDKITCSDKRLNEFLRDECDENLGQYVWIEQWTDKNCGEDIEKPGAVVDPIKLCGKYNQNIFAQSCPDRRLASCSQKRCDPQTERYICIEEWQTKDEEGSCKPYSKDGVLTEEYCGTAFAIAVEKKLAEQNTQEGCSCENGLTGKVWVGSDCGDMQNQSCEKTEETKETDNPPVLPANQNETGLDDCEETTNEDLPIQYRTLARKKTNRVCASKLREEAMDQKPLTYDDIGNGAKGISDGIGDFFGSIGTEINKRITDPNYRAQLQSESEAKRKSAQALAQQQLAAARISVQMQQMEQFGGSPAMQASMMRNFLQAQAPDALSSLDPNSTDQVKQAFIDTMAKNCISVTENDGQLNFSPRTGNRQGTAEGGDTCVSNEININLEDVANTVTMGAYNVAKTQDNIRDTIKTTAILRDNSSLSDVINLKNVPDGKVADAQRVKEILRGNNNFYDYPPSQLLEQALFYKALFDNSKKGATLSEGESANLTVYIDELKKQVPIEEQNRIDGLLVAAQLIPVDVAIGVVAKVGWQGIKGAVTTAGRTIGLVAKETTEQAAARAAKTIVADVGRNAEGKYVRTEVETVLKKEPEEVQQKVLADLGDQLDKPEVTAVKPEAPAAEVKPAAPKAKEPEPARQSTNADEALPEEEGAPRTTEAEDLGSADKPGVTDETAPAPKTEPEVQQPVAAPPQVASPAIDEALQATANKPLNQARSLDEVTEILEARGKIGKDITNDSGRGLQGEKLIEEIRGIKEHPELAASSPFTQVITNGESLRDTVIKLGKEEVERHSTNPVIRVSRTAKDIGEGISDSVGKIFNRGKGITESKPITEPAKAVLVPDSQIKSLADESIATIKGQEGQGYKTVRDIDIATWLKTEKGMTDEQAQDAAQRVITQLDQDNKGAIVQLMTDGKNTGMAVEIDTITPTHVPVAPPVDTGNIVIKDSVAVKVENNLARPLSQAESDKIEQIVIDQHRAENTYTDMANKLGGAYQKAPIADRATQVTEAFQTAITNKDPQTAYASFNSKPQGFIAIPTKSSPTEEVVRVYRGIERYNPNQLQAANALRAGGISTADINAYLNKQISLDDLARKSRTYKDGYLALEVKDVRERMTEKGISEIQALAEVHVLYERRIGGISPWVSATTDPTASLEFASGMATGFGPITQEGVSGVLVIDVPKSAVYDASKGFKSGMLGSGEVGIAGQIKPEWIRGFVPIGQGADKEAFTKTLKELDQALGKNTQAAKTIIPTVETKGLSEPVAVKTALKDDTPIWVGPNESEITCNSPCSLSGWFSKKAASEDIPMVNGAPRGLTGDEVKTIAKVASNGKQPALTRTLLSEPTFRPGAVLKIDDQELYLGKVIHTDGRDQAIMYVKGADGKFTPRVLYKSNSDGGWRSTPGSIRGTYSKGNEIHYTQETKPHEAIIKYLENAEAGNNTAFYKGDLINDYFSISDLYNTGMYTFDKEVIKYQDRGILTQFQKYMPGYSRDTDYATLSRTFKQFDYSSRELRSFVPDFSKPPVRSSPMEHTLLGKVNTETYSSQLNGRPVEWVMAYDRDGRVWVDKITFTDSKINSYGVPSEVINSGALTNKPIEYTQQVDYGDVGKAYPKFNSQYVDITPLLDNLAPIQEFRRTRNIAPQRIPQGSALARPVNIAQRPAPVLDSWANSLNPTNGKWERPPLPKVEPPVIANARTTTDLFDTLDTLGRLDTSVGYQSSQELQQKISSILDIARTRPVTENELALITRTNGLRDKVRELAQQKQTQAYKPVTQIFTIPDANSWTQLYQAIDQIGGIQGSSSYYPATYLKGLINSVRNGAPIDTITRSGGLRDKVQGLINKGVRSLRTPSVQDKLLSLLMIPKVFAQAKEETASNSGELIMNLPISQDQFKKLESQTEAQHILQTKNQVSISDIATGIKDNSQIQPAGYRTDNKTIIMTGGSGTVDFEAEKGPYNVEVTAINGADINIPATVNLTKNEETIFIGVNTGSGKINNIPQEVSSNNTSDKNDNKISKVKTIVFQDKNNNGKLDQGEKTAPWGGVTITLIKLIMDQTVSLEPGWNLITLTAKPSETMTASKLISEIAAQGGYATTVSTLVDGSWKTYVARGDKEFSNIDFTLQPGKAYFVKSIQRSLFVFKGQQFDKPVNLKLSHGWNAVGFPKASKTYTASTMIDAINIKQVLADALARFEAGLWDTFVKKAKEEYGENFDIERNRGYILRMEKEREFSP